MITDHTYDYIIGIDPGTQCGFAVWDVRGKNLQRVGAHRIWELFHWIENYEYDTPPFMQDESKSIHLIIEDPTQVRFKTDPKKSQGAGAVKWCFRQIVDFCEAHHISYETRRPSKQLTKYSATYFKTVTGYSGSTNQHGRDAAMLVYGHSGRVVKETVGA